jgi:hypothetical protein
MQNFSPYSKLGVELSSHIEWGVGVISENSRKKTYVSPSLFNFKFLSKNIAVTLLD